MTAAFLKRLEAAVGGLVDPSRLALLAAHWELVAAWNSRVNLTSIGEEQAPLLHYRDSLAPLAVLEEQPGPWVDMGSGAGFPGVPLAIARPGVSVTLVEPRQKRASFLRTVKARLGLDNVRVIVGRSTDAADRRYAALITRATFSDDTEILACRRWVAPSGLLIAMRAADAVVPPGAEVHRYQLQAESRSLHVWRL